MGWGDYVLDVCFFSFSTVEICSIDLFFMFEMFVFAKQHPFGWIKSNSIQVVSLLRTPRMDQWVSKTGNNAKCSAIIAVSTTGSSCQSCHSFLHRSHPRCIPFNLHRIRQIGMLVKVPEVMPSGLVKHGVPLGNPRTSRGVSHRKLIKLNEVLSGVMVDCRRVS